MSEDKKYIKIAEGGLYLVFGGPKIVEQIIIPNEEGASWEYKNSQEFKADKEPTALCRCGKSKNKPYCDGSHTKADWDATETAPHEPILDNAEVYEGPNLNLWDNQSYCAYARFCDAKGRVWNLVMEGTPETDKLAVRECANCPSGRLMISKKDGEMLEPNLEESIGVIEDSQLGVSGPLWVKGGIKVIDSKGKEYEQRNRQTLCCCGGSSNKPFCDGTHAGIKFKDGLDNKV